MVDYEATAQGQTTAFPKNPLDSKFIEEGIIYDLRVKCRERGGWWLEEREGEEF